MYGFIVLKYSGKTEQLIARNALNAQNAVCAEGIQPTRGAMIEKRRRKRHGSHIFLITLILTIAL